MKTIVAAVLVILACGAALLFSQSGHAPEGPVAPAVPAVPALPPHPPAAFEPLPPAAPPPPAAVKAPGADRPDLQGQFDRALSTHDAAIERFLINGKGINTERIAVLSTDDNYAHFVERMRADANQQALNDTVAFQQFLLSQRAVTSGAVAVSDVVCGTVVCAASVSGLENDKVAAYYMNLAQGSGAPRQVYSSLYVPYLTPSGFGVRLVFSIDGAVGGVSIPRSSSGS